MVRATRTRQDLGAGLLTILVAVQALSGLAGGLALVIDPSGGVLQMPVSALRSGPFSDFLVPGLILLLVLGALPAVVAVALWRRPPWRAVAGLERAFGEHWSWVGAGVVGAGLLIWLAVESWMVGPSSLLWAYAALAAAILIVALAPGTRRSYRAGRTVPKA